MSRARQKTVNWQQQQVHTNLAGPVSRTATEKPKLEENRPKRKRKPVCAAVFVNSASEEEDTKPLDLDYIHKKLFNSPKSSTQAHKQALDLKNISTPQLVLDIDSTSDTSYIQQVTMAQQPQQQDPLLLFIQQMAEREEKTRLEAAAREERMMKMFESIATAAAENSRKHTEVIQAITTANAESARKQAAVQQEKMKQDQQNMEMMHEQARKEADRRAYEFDQMQEQAKKDRKEKERQERLKQLPKPQPMTAKEDIQDYLELFEANMRDRELPKDTWAHHLLPLLNQNCKAAVSSLPIDTRYDYTAVTELILNTCVQTSRYPGQQLLEGGTMAAGRSIGKWQLSY